MIVTLTGKNTFLLQASLNKLVNDFIQEYGDIAFQRIDGEEVSDVEYLRESLLSAPFLSARKMVVVRAPGFSKDFILSAANVLAEVPDFCDLVIVEPQLDRRSSYFKTLQKLTEFKDYKELDTPQLVRWLVETAAQKGGSLSRSDAQALISRTSPNQQMLDNELEKLLLYDARITLQSIRLLTEETPQSSIFQLLEAAFAGNQARALALYKEQRSLGTEAPQIIAMLVWQLHILATVIAAGNRSMNTIAADSKINAYVLSKSAVLARNLKLSTIKTLVSELLAIDSKRKQEAHDVEESLQYYILSLSRVRL